MNSFLKANLLCKLNDKYEYKEVSYIINVIANFAGKLHKFKVLTHFFVL